MRKIFFASAVMIVISLLPVHISWAQNNSLPERTIPQGFGVNCHFTGNPSDLDLISQAGFSFIRKNLTWDTIEKVKGEYDFTSTGYDGLTEGCYERGMRIIYTLCYGNPLYEQTMSVQTPEGREAFAKFAETAVKRYSGKGILWEIWSEPNIGRGWIPQPSENDYCELVKVVAPRIKKADPAAIVIGGATSSIAILWLEECFKRGLLEWIDVLSFHHIDYRIYFPQKDIVTAKDDAPGGLPHREKPPEAVAQEYTLLKHLITLYAPQGKTIPVISSEWEYALFDWNSVQRLTEEEQASLLARTYLINLYENIPLVIWSDWKDHGTNPFWKPDTIGLMTLDMKPRLAYTSVKTLTHILNGYTFKDRFLLDKNDDYIMRFQKGSLLAIACWTISNNHTIKLPLPAGKGVIVDINGTEKPVSWGKSGLKINISQTPQYLIIK